MAVFIGEDSLVGGAFSGFNPDFFTGSPRIRANRADLDERNKHPSLFIAVSPAQPIRKTVQHFHIPLTYAVLRRCRREPISSNALVRRQLLHLHPSLHQLRSSGLGKVPHPSSDLRVRQRTIRITAPDVPNEVLVVDQPLVSFSRCVGNVDRRPLPRWGLPALQILGL